jgi:hypothetical protein
MSYVADPTNRLLPIDAEFVANGPAELRSIKGYIQDAIINAFPLQFVAQTGLSQNLPVAGKKLTGLTLNPTTPDEAVSNGYVMALYAAFASGAFFTGTSETLTLMATGILTFNVDQTSRAWAPGTPLRLASLANPANYMQGYVLTYTSTTGVLTMLIGEVTGAGSYADWQIGPDSTLTPILNAGVGSARKRRIISISNNGATMNSLYNIGQRSRLKRAMRQAKSA